ncbi:hypothetical protein, partial [Tsukamurella conjunctivitidis]|uniref:hypothetical protein n=1 Tax=Tsukamurella conjunctivitidis TaxID=2592068 RepID=UPI00195F5F9C
MAVTLAVDKPRSRWVTTRDSGFLCPSPRGWATRLRSPTPALRVALVGAGGGGKATVQPGTVNHRVDHPAP